MNIFGSSTIANVVSISEPSINNNLITMNGSSGRQIKDSGVSISSLATNISVNNTSQLVPPPLNSVWAMSATINFGNPSLYVSHNNVLVNTQYTGGGGPCQLIYSTDEGITWANCTSNIAFNNTPVLCTFGYDPTLRLAVFYSSAQYGTSTNGIAWTLVNQANPVAVTYDSYYRVQYNSFYKKWIYIGDTQQIISDPLSWGTFTTTSRSPAGKSFQFAINQTTGRMVSTHPTDGVAYSTNMGSTWTNVATAQKGYTIINAWDTFFGCFNGYIYTSSDGITWSSTIYSSCGLSGYGGFPLEFAYIPSSDILVLGLVTSGVSAVPTLAYRTKNDPIWKTTPLSGGSATNLEIMSINYIPSTEHLSITYYAGLVAYATSVKNTIVPGQLIVRGTTYTNTLESTIGMKARNQFVNLTKFINTVDVTVANTTTQTTLCSGIGSLIYAANTTATGLLIRVKIGLDVTAFVAGGTLNITGYVGGNQVYLGAWPPATQSQGTLCIELCLRASNFLRCQGLLTLQAGNDQLYSTNTAVWNPTVSNTLDFRAQWSVASASNSVTAYILCVESINQV